MATADDVPAMVRYLREHDSYARAVASLGRARLAALDVRAIAAFNAELFTQYAAKQRFRVKPLPGAAADRHCETSRGAAPLHAVAL